MMIRTQKPGALGSLHAHGVLFSFFAFLRLLPAGFQVGDSVAPGCLFPLFCGFFRPDSRREIQSRPAVGFRFLAASSDRIPGGRFSRPRLSGNARSALPPPCPTCPGAEKYKPYCSKIRAFSDTYRPCIPG